MDVKNLDRILRGTDFHEMSVLELAHRLSQEKPIDYHTLCMVIRWSSELWSKWARFKFRVFPSARLNWRLKKDDCQQLLDRLSADLETVEDRRLIARLRWSLITGRKD